MASTTTGAGGASNAPAHQPLEAGPFVLRTLLDEVPLSPEGPHDDIKINCVDYLGVLCMATGSQELETNMLHYR